jgi:putative acetyltransferase
MVTIRAERAEDHTAIASIVEAAFRSPAEARLVEMIRASSEYRPSLALVAEDASAVVGHVMISGAILRNDAGDRPIVMLSPLAVAPGRQSAGIGAALVHRVCELAAEEGEPFVVLEGSPIYYGRLGFEPSASYGVTLPLPDWAGADAAQIRWLGPVDPTINGVVVYPAAFDQLTD